MEFDLHTRIREACVSNSTFNGFQKEAKSIKVTEIRKYLTYDQATNQPEALHPAVPHADVLWLRNFMLHQRSGELISFERALFVFQR